MKRVPIALLVCAGLTPSLGPHAATPEQGPDWYQVELILFERPSETRVTDEEFPADPGSPSRLNALPLHRAQAEAEPPAVAKPSANVAGAAKPAAIAPPQPDRLLDPDTLQLAGLVDRLRQNPTRYRVLFHGGWRQPGLEPEKSPLLYLEVDAPRSSGLIGAGRPDAPRLEGTLRLSQRRFLHLELDLLLRRPPLPSLAAAGGTGLAPQAERYRLQERRRLRSGELHYFDHPLIGALVQVSPWELPPPPAPQAAPQTPEITQPPPAESPPSSTSPD